MNDVLVVGSVAYDDVETPFGRREDLLGGSATYFSIASSLFTRAQLVGVVGTDFRPQDRELLESRRVDIRGLTVDDRGETFRWGGRYHDNMNDRTTLYTHLNVFADFVPELPSAYRGARFVFLGNIDPTLQGHVLDQVQRPDFVALDTMNFWIDGKREALEAVLKRVNCLVINDEEGNMLTGKRTAKQIGQSLQKMGPQTIVLKRGEHGALLFHGTEIFHLPAFPLDAVADPTGAGDTFAGGFVGYLARRGEVNTETLRQAMITGSIMASCCVEGFGLDRLREVDLDEVRSRYRRFLELTRCPALTL